MIFNAVDFTTSTYPANSNGWGLSKTGVRITHIPTGIYVDCASERSQHANRNKAFEDIKVLLAEPVQLDLFIEDPNKVYVDKRSFYILLEIVEALGQHDYLVRQVRSSIE